MPRVAEAPAGVLRRALGSQVENGDRREAGLRPESSRGAWWRDAGHLLRGEPRSLKRRKERGLCQDCWPDRTPGFFTWSNWRRCRKLLSQEAVAPQIGCSSPPEGWRGPRQTGFQGSHSRHSHRDETPSPRTLLHSPTSLCPCSLFQAVGGARSPALPRWLPKGFEGAGCGSGALVFE